MKIRYIIIAIILSIIVPPKTNAAICGKTDILRVKNEANKVTINYELNELGTLLGGSFNIKIKGITEDLTIFDKTNNKRYTINSAVDGVITIYNVQGNDFVFEMIYEKCASTLLRTEKLKLPKYNYYSESSFCKDIAKEELTVCDPWYQGELTDESFEKIINEYKKFLEEKKSQEKKENTIFKQIKDFLLEYYIYIIATITLIVIITFIIVVRKKRYSLD